MQMIINAYNMNNYLALFPARMVAYWAAKSDLVPVAACCSLLQVQLQ